MRVPARRTFTHRDAATRSTRSGLRIETPGWPKQATKMGHPFVIQSAMRLTMFRCRFFDDLVGRHTTCCMQWPNDDKNREFFSAKPHHLVGPARPTTTYRHFLSPPNTPKSNAETVSCVSSPPEITTSCGSHPPRKNERR